MQYKKIFKVPNSPTKTTYNFYLDESGQDGSTPLVVYGGFGIDNSKEPAFISDILELFKFCYGHSYDGSYELKGSKIYEEAKIKLLSKFKNFDDEERQNLTAAYFNQSHNSRGSIKNKAALAQAGLLFVKGLLPLLIKYEVIFLESSCIKGIEVPIRGAEMREELQKSSLTEKDNFYTTFLLNELAFHAYNKIFKVSNTKKVVQINVITDYSSAKSSDSREIFFYNSYKTYENKVDLWARLNGSKKDISFKMVDSKQNILIQIADILIYIFNWNNYDEHLSNMHEISKEKIATIKLFDKSNFFYRHFSLWYTFDNVDNIVTDNQFKMHSFAKPEKFYISKNKKPYER